MNAKDININDIVVTINRGDSLSTVGIVFEHNLITINASMRCPNLLGEEDLTQDTIMTYLGFSDEQIQRMHHD